MDMEDNIKMREGISFLNLIENNKILVPKIQRDYAQGRLDIKVSEIRNNFLTSIFEALTAKESAPLLLDFIYGSTQNNLFTPLDGQQRLTTLFLLHWYFIPESKKSLLFKVDGNSCYSLFSYETRISSKDFCNALALYSCNDLKSLLIQENATNIGSQKQLSDIIKNQSWFLWSWRKDPTVKAMLVMLDEIEARVKQVDVEAQDAIWEQLEKRKIIFHLLPLEQFALTDELYVKMNARGKELSPFDIFKSSLEEQMQLNEVSEEIQNKWKSNIDSNWIDLFWNKLAKNNIGENTASEEQKRIVESVEKGFLIFFKRLTGLYFAENISILKYDIKDFNIQRLIPFNDYDENNLKRKLLDQAIQKDISKLFPLFFKTCLFNESFFTYAIDVFENMIYKDQTGLKHEISDLVNTVSFSKENSTLFDSFINESIDYETYLLFYSLMCFCRTNKTPKLLENVDLKKELNCWIRIIRNLSTLSNSFIDDVEDFQTTLIIYQSWCEEVYGDKGGKSINHYFANQRKINEPKGRFVKDQFEEEIIKAILIEDIEDGNKWQKEITNIEEHGYFLGQIRFLLHWSKNEGQYELKKFSQYKNIVKTIFDPNGLKSELIDKENHLFRNCLMANCENYLLLKDDCFVSNTGKERDRSWKSYLRNSQKSQNIKIVLDKYIKNGNSSFIEFCKTEIDNATKNTIDWRRCFLIKPEIYNRCEQNQIDYWDRNKMEICLLETSKKWIGFNRHSELNTYYWYLMFDGQNKWSSMYFNSQTETPLTTLFVKEEMNVNVYFENIDGNHKYNIDLNFDPEETEFLRINNNWSKHFESNNFMDVETFLNKILT